jgi:hypothetical protein
MTPVVDGGHHKLHLDEKETLVFIAFVENLVLFGDSLVILGNFLKFIS